MTVIFIAEVTKVFLLNTQPAVIMQIQFSKLVFF